MSNYFYISSIISSSITYANPSMLPKLAEWHVYGNEQQGRFLTKFPEELTPTYYGTEVTDDIKDNKFKRQLGKKSYELKDHLGNVRTTFSDIKMPTGSGSQPFRVDLLSKSEYYPYGMQIEELSYNSGSSRYSYNSQEKDVELNKNMLSAEFWEYDARSTRRWNLDPVDQISKSNYSTFASNPIVYNDLNGDNPDFKFDSPNSMYGIGFKGMSKEDKKRFSDARDKAFVYGFLGIATVFVGAEASPVVATTGAPLIMKVASNPSVNRLLNRFYINADKIGGTIGGFFDPNPATEYTGFDLSGAINKTFSLSTKHLDDFVAAVENRVSENTLRGFIKFVGDKKIISTGVVHNTGQHWSTMINIATDIAGDDGVVYLKLSINTALGKKIAGIGGNRPDIMKVNDDGSVFLVEVLSEKQSLKDLKLKLAEMVKTLDNNGIPASGKVVSVTGEEIK